MDDPERWLDTDPDRDPDAHAPTDEAVGGDAEDLGEHDLGGHDLEEDDRNDDEIDDDDLDADDLDDATDGEPEATWVHCPYCGEAVELLLDPGGGAVQEYVEDCEVCCRPWRVEVSFGRDGLPTVELFTDDE
ncbi:MAG: CPXCG motif-containing cysteine-rich protein [Gemmatimonadetes bacterium]|nr:CPXCG motif-containing cysteine-rich protein [Gemmatimonadota bacterium]